MSLNSVLHTGVHCSNADMPSTDIHSTQIMLGLMQLYWKLGSAMHSSAYD